MAKKKPDTNSSTAVAEPPKPATPDSAESNLALLRSMLLQRRFEESACTSGR